MQYYAKGASLNKMFLEWLSSGSIIVTKSERRRNNEIIGMEAFTEAI